MGIKILLLQILWLINLYGGLEEIQLKYKISKPLLFKSTSPFNFKQFSTYDSSDIYFDTSNFDIYSKGMSLRFRKVLKDGRYVFEFQLKTEDMKGDGQRVEVEDKSLDGYQVDGKKLELTLNSYFQILSKKPLNKSSLSQEEKKISQWFEKFQNLWSAPLQELKHLKIDVKKLKPQIYAHFVRQRFHMSHNNYSSNLIAEASQDVGFLLSIQNEKKYNLIEVEVENKSFDKADFDTIVNELPSILPLKSQFNSKYRQAVKFFKLIPRN